MVNPIASVFDWFVSFYNIIPQPILAFMFLALAIYFVGCFARWFL